MKFLRLVWRNVFRKRTRALLTIASIVLVLVLIVILSTLLRALEVSDTGSKGAARVAVQHATGLANFLPLAYRAKMEQVPGVVAVAPQTWFAGTYIDQRPQNFFGQLSTDPAAWERIYEDYEIDGEALDSWQRQRDSFIAGQELVERYGWKIGDRVLIRGSYIQVNLDLVLAGVYRGPDESNIFFHNTYLENSWVGQSGQTGIYFLITRRPEDVPAVTAAIDRMFENSSAPVSAMPEKQFVLQFVEMLGNIRLLVRSISLTVLFTVVLIVANTMAMSARERVGEIAVMRALGFRRAQVLGLVLAEAVLLALVGGVAGVLISFPFSAAVIEGMRHSPAAMFAYNLQLHPATVAMAFATAVGIGAAAGFVPAIRSARLSIVDGLRKVA